MPILFLLQQYQEVILTLMKMTKKIKMKGWDRLASAFFTLRASQYCWVGWVGCFVVAHSRYTNTASWATSSHPLILGWGGGPWLVNNPG